MQIKKIRQLNPQELDEIVELHLKNLDESFINNFGKKFLKIAYSTIVKNPKNICLIILSKNQVLGYLIATNDGNEFNKDVINQNFLKLSVEIIKNSIFNPKIIYLLIFWKLFGSKKAKLPAELQFVAINPNFQGKGLGTKLISMLNKEFKKMGTNQYRVGTKSKNKLSNQFYLKKGFKFTHQEYFFGDKFNYYLSEKF